MFSADQMGEEVDGQLRPTVQSRLAWVLTWRNLECTPAAGPIGHSQQPPEGVRCLRIVAVDAMTRAPLGAWETDVDP